MTARHCCFQEASCSSTVCRLKALIIQMCKGMYKRGCIFTTYDIYIYIRFVYICIYIYIYICRKCMYVLNSWYLTLETCSTLMANSMCYFGKLNNILSIFYVFCSPSPNSCLQVKPQPVLITPAGITPTKSRPADTSVHRV